MEKMRNIKIIMERFKTEAVFENLEYNTSSEYDVNQKWLIIKQLRDLYITNNY